MYNDDLPPGFSVADTEVTTEPITEATTEFITEATTEPITEATTEPITEATTIVTDYVIGYQPFLDSQNQIIGYVSRMADDVTVIRSNTDTFLAVVVLYSAVFVVWCFCLWFYRTFFR